MTVHSYHPDTLVTGLADDCPRCAEHAQHPRESLDRQHLAQLEARVLTGAPPRTATEEIAMRNWEAGR